MKRAFCVVILGVIVFAVSCGGDSKESTPDLKQDVTELDSNIGDASADTSGLPDSINKPDHGPTPDGQVESDGTVEEDAAADVEPEDQQTPEDTSVPDAQPGQVFVPPPATATYVYRVGVPGGSPVDMPARYGDKEMYHGHLYRLMEVGDFTQEEITGVRIWALYENDTFQTGGAEVYNPGKLGAPSFAYAFDEPLLGNLNGEIGEEQVTQTTGQLIFGTDGIPFSIKLTYTLLSKDASVEVPAGKFDGCIHYKIVEDSNDLQGYEAEYWLKSGVGMIKATVIPGFDAMELVSYDIP